MELNLETPVDAWYRAWAARDFDALEAMYHPDAEYVRPDGVSSGAGQIVSYLKALAAADPWATATVTAAHGSSEAVTIEWTEQHAPGPEGGVAWADRVVDVFRLESGRIVSHHQYLDPTRRLQLLAGLVFRTLEPGRPDSGPLELLVSIAPSQDPAATIAPNAVPMAFDLSPAGPEPPAAGMAPALRIDTGPDSGISRPMQDDNLSVGRALDNDLVLGDPATSGHHARFERLGEQVFVVDLESTNGTYVNGERVLRQQLGHGDRVAIGQDTFVLALPEAPDAA